MKHNKVQIQKMYNDGMTYQQIADILGTCRSAIAYHINPSVRKKGLDRDAKYRKNLKQNLQKRINKWNRQIVHKKLNVYSISFQKSINRKRLTYMRENRNKAGQPTFTVEQLLEKLGDNPKCYLTGRSIDLNNSKSFQFDHIIPRSRGGNNSLNNLGLASSEANQAKHKMTKDEFVQLCLEVVCNNGYKII